MGEDEMTEEQRVKLEELISDFEQVVLLTYDHGFSSEYIRSAREKAYDRITDHLDSIQWNAALYNFQRFGVKDLEDLDLSEEDAELATIHREEERANFPDEE